MRQGVLHAGLAYVCWGLFPLYFRLLQGVPAPEILAHRIVWSLVFLFSVLTVLRRWAWLGQALRNPLVLARFALSASLLAANWYIYIWAIGQHRVVDASLGYFITPLANVLTGWAVLGERLRPAQTAAVALAAAAVGWLTWQLGTLPWIALALAATFASYGLSRKTASLGALEGLTLESLLLAPLAAAALLWWLGQGQAAITHGSASQTALLLFTGPLTAVPLLLFAAGARRIPLSVLGMLQYIGPSLQLLVGVLWLGEHFGGARLQAFSVIWLACALFSLDALRQHRRAAAPAAGSA